MPGWLLTGKDAGVIGLLVLLTVLVFVFLSLLAFSVVVWDVVVCIEHGAVPPPFESLGKKLFLRKPIIPQRENNTMIATSPHHRLLMSLWRFPCAVRRTYCMEFTINKRTAKAASAGIVVRMRSMTWLARLQIEGMFVSYQQALPA